MTATKILMVILALIASMASIRLSNQWSYAWYTFNEAPIKKNAQLMNNAMEKELAQAQDGAKECPDHLKMRSITTMSQ